MMKTKEEPEKTPGMIFEGYREVSLDDIEPVKFNNVVRTKGLDTDYVAKFQDCMNKGHYKPENELHTPPAGKMLPSGKIQLLDGHHRHAAHVVLEKETMYMMILRFEKTIKNGIELSVECCEELYQSRANIDDNRNVRNERDDEDVVSIVARRMKTEVKRKDVDISDPAKKEIHIRQMLKLHFVKPGKMSEFINKVFTEMGDFQGVVETITQECHAEIARGIEEKEGVPTVQSPATRPSNPDYENRGLDSGIDIMLELEASGKKVVCPIYVMKGVRVTASELKIIHGEKADNMLERTRKRLDFYGRFCTEHGLAAEDLINPDTVVFCPQLELNGTE